MYKKLPSKIRMGMFILGKVKEELAVWTLKPGKKPMPGQIDLMSKPFLGDFL
jgi:hypothetical protein